MSVTMSASALRIGFRPVHMAGRARPAGLRSAGCLPQSNTRSRRVAVAESPPPPAWAEPPQGPPLSDWEVQHKQDVDKFRAGNRAFKIISVILLVFFAFLDMKSDLVIGGAVKLAAAIAMLILPSSA